MLWWGEESVSAGRAVSFAKSVVYWKKLRQWFWWMFLITWVESRVPEAQCWWGGAWWGLSAGSTGEDFPCLGSRARPVSSWPLPAVPGGCQSSWSQHDMEQNEGTGATFLWRSGFLPCPLLKWHKQRLSSSGDCRALCEGLHCRFLLTNISDSSAFQFDSLLTLGCEIELVFCGAVSCNVENSVFLFVFEVLYSPATA